MSMTRKDYVGLAEAINREVTRNPNPKEDSPGAVLSRVVTDVADYLSTTNPAFDYGRFLSACFKDVV